ncbi:EAL domain-containing protein [Nitratireductor sp. XY-223]|uniref:EAL domain-containing protein n=1 Tax=Nitratireductor sp. XY-223 TaxID=2561926 RepID=UPI001FEEDEAA|nr:EAL domain-containing protein [Nitratireductor sp. XY-223]
MRHLALAACALLALLFSAVSAFPAETVKISRDDTALDLTATTDVHVERGNAFQTSTAPDADGIVRRIEVRASSDRHSGDWAEFSLANVSDEQLDRLIVAPHFRLANSGLFWPDLGSERIVSITPSEGFALDRVPSDEADVFHITLNPGAIITFVAELSSPDLPQLYLWEPEAYKDTINSFTLYKGIVLGIAGLLAVFLTILFVVKGTSVLPATAALAWAVLAYICVDFGFLSKLVQTTPTDERIWRAGTEITLAAGLVIFLFTYLNLNRWHTNLSFATLAWIVGLGILSAFAVYDPVIATGLARFSFAATVIAGTGLIAYLGLNRFDRAIMLIPTWVLIICWLFGAWLTVSGQLSNDIVQPALGGGLVLIVLLIGFTVMQHAFAGGGAQQGLFSDLERQSLALTGSGDIVWDWDVSRDRIVTMPDVSRQLGLSPGSLFGPARNWLPRIHPDDRDRFRTTLDVVLEHRRGRLNHQFRIRAEDGHYHWLALRARPVVGSDGEVIRCVGTLIDVTEQKSSEERLLHDAVHDNLTGLPNRELFVDRLDAIIALASAEEAVRPTIFAIDIDRFKQVNDELGISAGDTILLTIARRLKRLLKPQDTLARISGDQFGLILLSEQEPAKVAAFSESIAKAIMVPINFGQKEIILTASIGLVTWVDEMASPLELVKDAELAMYQAKRVGGNRIEPYRPAFRAAGADKLQIESDLRRALERNELTMVYQPIVDIESAEIAGFEALMRWDHPRKGNIPPTEFIPIAESSDLIVELGMYALQQACEDIASWYRTLGQIPIFMSVNLSSAQLLRNDLYNDIRSVLTKTGCKPPMLKLELTESVVMHNPEQAARVLARLKDLGLQLALDDFGTGHSSLSYLTRFPFDTIKIDQSLVRATNEKQLVLLRSIVAMARDLDMNIVAEGIETEEDAEELAELGCDYAQSFLFGPPIGANSVLKLLREHFPVM